MSIAQIDFLNYKYEERVGEKEEGELGGYYKRGIQELRYIEGVKCILGQESSGGYRDMKVLDVCSVVIVSLQGIFV